MSDKKKFWTVETSKQHYWGDSFDSFENAEARARSKAWENGEDYFIMGQVAVAKAPKEIVNSVQVEKVQ